MSLRSSCHPRISKEAVSMVPLFQMKMISLRLVVLNIGFTATLTGTSEDDFIETCGAEYWIYGHSHRNIDKLIGKTQCVSNQLGYVFAREHQSFDSGKIIDI